MQTDRHIRVVLVMPDLGYDRGIMRGIHAYARPGRRWLLHSAGSSLSELATISHWDPDGMVVHGLAGPVLDALVEMGRPMVNVSGTDFEGIASVRPDNVAAGRLAAEHLIERGHRDLAYFGLARAAFARARRIGVRQAVREAGGALHVFDPNRRPANDWQSLDRAHRQWLEELPRPVGVVACSDQHGRMLLESVYATDIRVPQEVAVVGVDNDDVHVLMTAPTLSSVELPLQRVGFEAARLLDSLMAGGDPPAGPIELPPVGVVQRGSSDTMAIADPDVAAALSHIADHADRPLTVEEVLEQVAVSRRTLEKKFRSVLGRTPLAEIRRAHIDRAKALLVRTDLPMPEVARQAGFTSAPALSAIFRKETGMPPTAWRRRHQLR